MDDWWFDKEWMKLKTNPEGIAWLKNPEPGEFQDKPGMKTWIKNPEPGEFWENPRVDPDQKLETPGQPGVK